jgi:hypothetical protein
MNKTLGRWHAIGQGSLLLAAAFLTAACADSEASTSPDQAANSTVTSMAASEPTATPVGSAEPAFADQTGGILEPANAGTTFPLSAAQVQHSLQSDGASSMWVQASATLVVRSGIYHPLVPGPDGSSLSPAATGMAAYVFSGDTGPCPPAGGGVGSPTAIDPSQVCTGTVVADGSSGDIIDVEITGSTT